MSDLQDLIHTNALRAYEQGVERERERIIKRLEAYFELSQLPGDNGTEENPEWDNGFQAAIALIKGKQK
jgi:hypothetical protein